MRTVSFLTNSPAPRSSEEAAAWRFLSSRTSFHRRRTSFASIRRTPSLLNDCHLLWWHLDSSTILPSSALYQQVVTSVREFVLDGGSLLLSHLAAQYVVDVGIEEKRPNVLSKGDWLEESWARGYPDIRGFATFQGHPIFAGLPGGVYTSAPTRGDNFSAAIYEDDLPKNGSVIAVERLYVRLNERRRLITEYDFGKGKILCIGTYFQFVNRRDRFRAQSEHFANNCFNYLLNPRKGRGRKTYWTFDPVTVRSFDHQSKPLEKIASGWTVTTSSLLVRRQLQPSDPDQPYDVGGRKLVLVGKERGGIEEVWCHPFRAIRNLRVGFESLDSKIEWSEKLNPEIVVHPESFTRIYRLSWMEIEEVVFANLHRPCGALHFTLNTDSPVHLVISAEFDLRMMWPLHERSAGSLEYCWDEGLQAVVVSGLEGRLTSLLGSSLKPIGILLGQYTAIEVQGGRFIGKRTDVPRVMVALRYRLTPESPQCTIVFAGSSTSMQDASKAYRSVVANPAKVLNNQATHYRTLFNRSTQVKTPDETFNAAYHWSLAATDRFFVEAPGLGSSLVAGYGSSSKGWNGGHEVSGRPGYAWFFGRDAVWTSFALLDYGDVRKVRDVLEFLGSHQDIDGKILHEMTTSGFAHYDAADSTPLYIALMGRYLKSSGDVKFVRKEFLKLKKAIDFCFSTDTDDDHLIENSNVGHGWIEGGKLFPVHTEYYLAACWAAALNEATYIASALKKTALARGWKKENRMVRRTIQEEFWNETSGSYNFGKYKDGSFNAEKTILPTVGMNFGCADPDKAQRSLDEYASSSFSTDWGVRIVEATNPLYNPAGYHYGSVWPLFTGWTALAEFRLGRPSQGFSHLMSNLQLCGQFAAGFMEEVLHGELLDAAGVCHHQAWSESMVLQPILEGMLGLEVDAMRSRLMLRPFIPPNWGSLSVDNLCVGRARVRLKVTRLEGRTLFDFHVSGSTTLTVDLQPLLPLGTIVSRIQIGSQTITPNRLISTYGECPRVTFRLTGSRSVVVHHSRGVTIIPPLPSLQRKAESRGLRIVNERLEGKTYLVTVEGRAGTEYRIDLADPDQSVRAVDGAEIVNRIEERIVLRTRFDESANGTSYSRKTIVFVLL